VGGDDGGHDRQAEPGPAGPAVSARPALRAGAGPGGVGPVEALEDQPLVARREARALVGHLQEGLAVVGPHPHVDGGAHRCVDPGVGQEIAGHLPEAGLVAGDDEAVGMLVGHRPGGVDGGEVGQGVGGHRDEIDRLALQRAALVETGQQEQVVDEDPHAGGLVLDTAHGPGQVLGPVGGAATEQFGVAPDGGQRRAQLVAGVGHEAAQPVLGRRPLAEGRLDLAQHGVQRQPEPADLGVGLGRLHPAGEVAAGDVAGGGGDALQGSQAEPHDRQRQDGQEQQDTGGEDQLDAHQPVQGLVELGGGEGHVEHGPVRAGGGQHPVAGLAVRRPDGRQPVPVPGGVGQFRGRPRRLGVLRGGFAGPAQLAERAAGDHRPARGQAPGEPLALSEFVEDRRQAGGELGIEPVAQVVGQRLVDPHAAGRQPDDGQGQQTGHQPGPERP
jgi:hypothetical protein